MLEYFTSAQSSSSALASIALNLAMIVYMCVSIKMEGRKNLWFKILFMIIIVLSTLSLIRNI